MIKNIVNWMIEYGTTNTESGNWCVYSVEIAQKFNVTEQWVIEHQNDICNEIDSRPEILSETWTSSTDGILVFDMNFCLDACKNLTEDIDNEL